jgi:hypothetical protein
MCRRGVVEEPNDPFASTAAELARLGLVPIPVGGPDGKKPLVNWPRRIVQPDSQALRIWSQRFPGANIGILTKLSQITIVDVDDPGLVGDMEKRFGPSPLITGTPSNGMHFWYRANGERCRNLRRSEGIAVDVKAGGAGKGGFVVVPPSVRPVGPHAGKAYGFIRGGWDDIARLPTIRAGSLPDSMAHAHDKGSSAEPFPHAAATLGERNNTLFHELLSKSRYCAGEEQLIAVGAEINAAFDRPLPDDEVVRTVKSVWGYRERDAVWIGREPHASVSRGDIRAFKGNGDALLLYLVLRTSHPARGEPFAISARAMGKASVIPGWGYVRYRVARDALLRIGLIKQLHWGGNGAHDSSKFVFG